MAIRKIVITGGVGCGKSTFTTQLAGFFTAPNVVLFSADAVVHSLYQDRSVRRKIAEELAISQAGDEVSPEDFRGLVRGVVISDTKTRERLEQLLHPLVWEAFGKAHQKLEASGGKVLLAEIPLYYETTLPVAVDLVVVVAASQATQIHRLHRFRSIELVAAKEILGMQLSLEEKVRRADLVIWNDGSLDNLRAQSAMLSKFIELNYFDYGTSD